jgi:hypothetical protein
MSPVTVMELISVLMIVLGLGMIVFDFTNAQAGAPVRLRERKDARSRNS